MEKRVWHGLTKKQILEAKALFKIKDYKYLHCGGNKKRRDFYIQRYSRSYKGWDKLLDTEIELDEAYVFFNTVFNR